MSFVPILEYLFGLGVFGFIYWILDDILTMILSCNVHSTGTTLDLLLYLWAGCLLIYLIFGGWWITRKYGGTQL